MVRYAAIAASVVGAVAITLAQQSESDTPFRSTVNVVSITVTVQNADGSFARELSRENFHVFESGVEQPISVFGRGEVPIDLVLLLDTSSSMGDRLGEAKHAAAVLVNALSPADRVTVL